MNRFRPLLAFVLCFGIAHGQTVPTPGSEAPNTKPQPLGGQWEARYIDNSTMKITILDDVISLSTAYGPLQIPLRDVRRIEFGPRWSIEELSKFDKAMAEVTGKDAARREKGKAAILDLGIRALPAVRRAAKAADPEALPHLEQIAGKLQAALPNPKDEPRDYDLIVTDESRIAGRIQAPALRIQTFQFGELKLKVTDVAVLSMGPDLSDEKLEIIDGKRIYELLQTHMGKTIGIRTTGAIQGAVWGSGPFTGDSDLATAAVFAGALKVGQTGVVKVKLVPNPGAFQGGNANGVVTSPYGQYPTGAYEIIVK